MPKPLGCNIITAPDGSRLIMVVVQPTVNVSNIYPVSIDNLTKQADNDLMNIAHAIRAGFLRYDFHVAHDIGEPMGF